MSCLFNEADMNQMIALQQQTVAELKSLNKEHAAIMRWLLITVCVLALGKALPEVREVFWPIHPKAQAEVPK